MMKISLQALLYLCVILSLSNCNLILKTESGYKNFENDSILDSTQKSHKEIWLTFTNSIKNKDFEKVKLLSSDSVFCSWESGLDSMLLVYNNNLMPIDEFVNTYYPQVFENMDYYSNPKNIFSIWPDTVGHIISRETEGVMIQIGPKKKCLWDNCGYYYFDFIKTNKTYKFLGMWHL